MITLHRLGHRDEPLHVNHDLIISVEAHPDTVIHLTTGDRIVVAESSDEVVDKVRECRVEILAGAMLCREAAEAQERALAAQTAARPNLTAVQPPGPEPLR
jgi:flagellar protein FlbD